MTIIPRIRALAALGLALVTLAACGTLNDAVPTPSASTARIDAAPREVWTAIPGFRADPHWSEDYYAVLVGAVRPRRHLPNETAAQTATLDAAWEKGIRTYLRRVSNTMGGMNHPDPAQRQRYCAAMADLLHENFVHTEGRRIVEADGSGGFVFRTKSELQRACANRAFQLTGFALYSVSAWVMSDGRTVAVEGCYVHNQNNDPKVRGVSDILMNGRPVVPRIANETITISPAGRPVIEKHWAVDSDIPLVLGGCRSGMPPLT